MIAVDKKLTIQSTIKVNEKYIPTQKEPKAKASEKELLRHIVPANNKNNKTVIKNAWS